MKIWMKNGVFLLAALTAATSPAVAQDRLKTYPGYEAYQRFVLTSAPATKMTVYGDLLRAMLIDQLAFLADPSHERVITEENGRDSLRMSVAASHLATA